MIYQICEEFLLTFPIFLKSYPFILKVNVNSKCYLRKTYGPHKKLSSCDVISMIVIIYLHNRNFVFMERENVVFYEIKMNVPFVLPFIRKFNDNSSCYTTFSICIYCCVM